jgi:hypothetical protein
MRRHFSYKHPTFGTKNKPKSERAWKSSVYYWWWEYLKRNESYRRTCENEGKGKCAKLYEDFGNIYTKSFKEWWSVNGRAVHLFAEPATPSIQLLDVGTVVQAMNGKLVMEVPLNLPIAHLTKSFKTILAKHHKGKRGIRANQNSQARYTVSGKVDLSFLEAALRVWDYRNAHPELPLWRIAQDTRVVPAKHWVKLTDTQAESADKRNLLTATASRYFKKASMMIANVGCGRFPVSTSRIA